MRFATWMKVLAVACLAALPEVAAAQPAGYELAGEGRVMARKGDNLIVDVTRGAELGYRKFKLTSASDIVFYRDGKEIQPLDLRAGNIVQAYRKTGSTNSSVVMTHEEAEKEVAAAEPAPAPAAPAPAPAAAPAAEAPAPAPESKPAQLPDSGSRLPLALALGALLVTAGAGLTLTRR